MPYAASAYHVQISNASLENVRQNAIRKCNKMMNELKELLQVVKKSFPAIVQQKVVISFQRWESVKIKFSDKCDKKSKFLSCCECTARKHDKQTKPNMHAENKTQHTEDKNREEEESRNNSKSYNLSNRRVRQGLWLQAENFQDIPIQHALQIKFQNKIFPNTSNLKQS